MRFTKVVTHDTAFHADDVMAVAMLRYAGYGFELVRTRDAEILTKSLADPEVVVLDVGGVYDPAMLNFDHHQDLTLQSAAGLVFESFKDKICEASLHPYFARFISSIDAIDTNRDNIFGIWNALPRGFRNTSSLIGAFNREVTDPTEQMNQFEKAVEFSLIILDNELYSCGKKAKSEADYLNRTVLSNNVAVFDEFSTVWKEKGEHQFAILPHANGWQIQSADTSLAIVPDSVAACDGFVFRHDSGFMAIVKEKSTAIAFAASL
jgi:uncharacterized UPF0160 family protein